MLTIGRLATDDPLDTFTEPLGDPIGSTGGTVVPAQRTPMVAQFSVPTIHPVVASDTVAARGRIKRQLRAMLNNTPLKLGGLYVAWDQDTEQNGWYIPDRGTITDAVERAIPSALFKGDAPWSLVGRMRTHLRAVGVYSKDLRTGTVPRDYFKTLYSTDFSTLAGFAVLALPCNVTDVVNSSTASPFDPSVGPFPLPRTSRDGGTEYQLTNATTAGLLDYGVVTYEQAEANRSLGDVVVLDRRGSLGPFGPANYAAAIGSDSPTSYYRLGESVGPTAVDQRGVNNGTYTGSPTLGVASLLTGDANTAITIPSTADGNYVLCKSGFIAAGQTNLSLEAWVKTSATPGANGATIYAERSTTGNDILKMEINSSGKLQLTYRDDAGTLNQVASSTSITDGLRHHVVVVKSGTTITTYIDGASNGAGGTLTATNTFTNANVKAQIGDDPVGGTTGFNGTIDEVAAYSGTALSGAQVGTHFNIGSGSSIAYDTAAGILDPQTTYGWEEVYGPDYPLTASDVPVIQNGRCRVRYSAISGVQGAGFRVEVFSGTAWTEQGFFVPCASGSNTGFTVDFSLTSAAVLEWTPDRAALLVVGVVNSTRVRCVITLQRGWSGPRVEVYLPTISANSPGVTWWSNSDTLNDLIAKNDGTPVQALGAAISGAGTPSWPANGTTIGASTFTGENWVSSIRAAAVGFNMTMGVVQANSRIVNSISGGGGTGYGNGTHGMTFHPNSGLYAQVNLSFYAQLTKQRQEAELMTLGTGTVSSADVNASAGNAATATRTTDANPHATDAALGFVTSTKHRVFLRVKTSASTGNFYVKTASTTGATVTTTSTAYVWLDCGEVVSNGTFEIHAWATAAATVSVDCYVAIKVEDRYDATNNLTPALDGARDVAAADLVDTRGQSLVVAR